MATVSFLWHLHQPAYRTADGTSHAPWVALHAGGSYATLGTAIADTGARGHVISIVPTLLEQLLAYRDGKVRDPVLDVLCRPMTDLGGKERALVAEWGQHLNARHLERSPRLHELVARIASQSGQTTTDDLEEEDLRDLQVLLILAHAGDQAWRDSRLEPLAVKGLHFDSGDHLVAAEWLRAQPGELVDLWRRIADLPGVEVATSPYAHPIMPLLIDSSVVRQSWAPAPPPVVPRFGRPEDARRQLVDGLGFMARHGFTPRGCWPPEGAVSEDALGCYREAGVEWLVADEGILERSLGRPLRTHGRARDELYRTWRLQGRGPSLFFRDRLLSDRIGFELGRWQNESAAAAELATAITRLARRLPDEAAIVIALDGENPWPHYPACGGVFLRDLMSRLDDAGPMLEPATLSAVASRQPAADLAGLHPGSWINGTFATWIGHPEKTAGWRLLMKVRDTVAGDVPLSLMLAEGSDWFWWLGDDNPTELAPLYDAIFRQHLRDACEEAGVKPPTDLDRPLKPPPR